MTALQVEEASRRPDLGGARTELVRAALVRAVWSRRQLFEVMVEFWSKHLNVTTPVSDGI